MIEIVDSTAAHARELSTTLRPKDRAEAEALGLDPSRATFLSYRKAFYRKTALIDGRVAAMWGVYGVPLGLVGYPYLITGTAVETIHPIKFARVYLSEVETMSSLFPLLENLVDATYKESIKMLQLARFNITGPFDYNGSLFYKFAKGGVSS